MAKSIEHNLLRFKSWILFIIIPQFLCFWLGHKKPVAMIIETKSAIYTTGCPRCKIHLGTPEVWKFTKHPPDSDKESVKIRERLIESYYNEIRNSVNTI